MGQIRLKTFSTMLMLVLGLLFSQLSFAQTATSETAADVKSSEVSYHPQLENIRDPNKYCAQCHKLSGEKFHGEHLGLDNPATGKPITCVSCHGNLSEDHRRGVKDVMRFHGDIFDETTVPMYSAAEQNQVCFSCHKPKDLRQAFWVHDVHAMKLPCASCHTLHSEKDAMEEIKPKDRVKLCVDCHGKQQQLKEAAKSLDKQKENQ